jgi:hypothetical protein
MKKSEGETLNLTLKPINEEKFKDEKIIKESIVTSISNVKNKMGSQIKN